MENRIGKLRDYIDNILLNMTEYKEYWDKHPIHFVEKQA